MARVGVWAGGELDEIDDEMAILNHVPNQSVCGVESVRVTMNYYSHLNCHHTYISSPPLSHITSHLFSSQTGPRRRAPRTSLPVFTSVLHHRRTLSAAYLSFRRAKPRFWDRSRISSIQYLSASFHPRRDRPTACRR